MELAIKREVVRPKADGQLLWCALLPLFVLNEGAHRALAGLKHGDSALTRRGWLAEARWQASIATSYVMIARSMLQQSERRNRLERLS